MPQPVKLGIIGCGVIGTMHAQAAASSKDIELLAVADLIDDKAHRLADLHHIPNVYRQGRDLLKNSDIQAIVLAFPTQQRGQLVKQALQSNRHVLVEKPVAMNMRELRSFLQLQGDRVAACASSRFRTYASASAAQRFISSEKLGDIRLIRIRAINPSRGKPQTMPPDWRLSKKLNAGGILVNWGVYDLDYILGIFSWKLKPISVTAQCWTIPPIYKKHVTPNSDAETHYTAMIRCAAGRIINIERGEYMPTSQPDAAWEITGSNGTLRLNMLPGDGKRLVFDRADASRGVVSKTIWQGDDRPDAVHAGPVRDFAHAIRFNHPPMTSLKQEADIVRITDAIYASSKREQTITL